MNQCQMHDYFTVQELEQEDLDLLGDFDRPQSSRPALQKRIRELQRASLLAWTPERRAWIDAKIHILEAELMEL